VRRSDLVLLLVVYVVPVGAAAVLLALVGLGVLAVALVVIEVIVGGAVVVAKRTPVQRAEPARRPWLIPTVMIAALALIVVVSVIGAHGG
jgi:hypothetical protein